MALITLIGLYNFDNSLFDGIDIEDIDTELLIENILNKSGNFEVLYPDFNYMKNQIAVWSDKYQDTFTKWMKGIAAEWNPIENYDRFEEITDSGENSMSGSDSNTSSGSGTNTQKKAAYDSSTFENDVEATSSTSGSSSTTMSSSGRNYNKRIAHIHGNIGVTTSTAMFNEFQEAALWNVYEHITDLFLNEFVIPVF